MAPVTVKGIISTTILHRGDTVTVERTANIDDLIEKGYLAAVEDQSPSEALPEKSQNDAPEKVELEEPRRNASRRDWAQFVRSEGMNVDPTDSREDIQAAWDQATEDMGEAEDDGDS